MAERREHVSAPPRTLLSEIRQSFELMGIMAAVLGFYVGLGLLAVRMLG